MLSVVLVALMLLSPLQALAIAPPAADASAATASAASVEAAELGAWFDERMTGYLDEYAIPGAAVAVVQGDSVLLSRGYGYADVAQQKAVDADTSLFRIASLTKLFTWTAVMQLVEQGKLDLNADVNTYLTAWQVPTTYAEPITLLHLMSHTAGFEDRGIGTAARTAAELPALGDYLAQHLPARVRPPGTLASYSNHGAALAGEIVAEVSGLTYEEYVEQHILAPLGMEHTTARQPVPAGLQPDAAQSYTYAAGQQQPVAFRYEILAPAAAMSASASDMGRFMIAHLQNGRYGDARILQQATAQAMHTTSFTHHPQLAGWAHGFQEMAREGQYILFHDGFAQNTVSLLLLAPEHELGLFVVFSSPGGQAALSDLVPAFLDRYLPATASPMPEPPDGFAARAQRFVGTYEAVRRPYTTIEKVTHGAQAGSLTVAGDGALLFLGQHWVEVEPLLFRAVESDDRLAFFEDGRGRIAYAALNAEAMRRLRWHELPSVRYGALLAALVVVLSGCAGWPLAAIVRRRQPRRPPSGPGSWVRWVAGLAGATALVFLAGLVLIVGQTSLLCGVPLSLRLLMVLPMATGALTAASLVGATLAWRGRYWGAAARVHYTLVTLSLLLLVWFMHDWNLLGFHFG